MSPLLARVKEALDEGGLNLLVAVPVGAWDGAGPPKGFFAEELLAGARSILVAGSGGRALWGRFTAWLGEAPRERLTDEVHPLDRYVATVLDRGDAILAGEGVRARRFEPTFLFQPRLDFRRVAALSGLGSTSPLGMIVHPVFGPWWGLRGAWFIDREVAASVPVAGGGMPCQGCAAPCRAAIPAGAEGTILAATRAARLACVLGEERYGEEQLTYHYDPAGGRVLMEARLGAK